MARSDLQPTDTVCLEEQLLSLWERTGDDWLRQLAHGEPIRGPLTRERGDEARIASDHRLAAPAGEEALLQRGSSPTELAMARRQAEQERLDWTSTCLMNCYKNTGDAQVFALLFDLNKGPFLQAIQSKVRRSAASIDPQDVLQEVFLNIYRYPHRFLAAKADSFRNWGHRIVRNTLLKFLKGQVRLSRFASLDDETADREDTRTHSPSRSAQDSESAKLVDRAYLIYLNLYLLHFNRLSDRERFALTLVEVRGASYKAAARELGIRLENLKMVIFRSRRKIFRALNRTLEDLGSISSTTR